MTPSDLPKSEPSATLVMYLVASSPLQATQLHVIIYHAQSANVYWIYVSLSAVPTHMATLHVPGERT